MKATQVFLRSLFLQLAATSLPLATIAVSCGGTGSGSDGGTDGKCGFPCGCYTPPPPVTLYVSAVCEAGADAGDGGCDCRMACPSSTVSDAGTTESLGLCYVSEAGANQFECHYLAGACAGRRPAGLARSKRRGFAEQARLEAASVHAFARLACELEENGAPRGLIRSARRARRDEIRHARTMSRLAGIGVPNPRVAPFAKRSLVRVARENAIEGCVRETFGALLATWQAERADDPAVRRAMRTIAKDETRHAALSWRVAAWADRKLDAKQRARVRAARDRAVRELERELDPEMQGLFATMRGALAL
jgi:hypothetical protein